jgi:hypothetical protein
MLSSGGTIYVAWKDSRGHIGPTYAVEAVRWSGSTPSPAARFAPGRYVGPIKDDPLPLLPGADNGLQVFYGGSAANWWTVTFTRTGRPARAALVAQSGGTYFLQVGGAGRNVAAALTVSGKSGYTALLAQPAG